MDTVRLHGRYSPASLVLFCLTALLFAIAFTGPAAATDTADEARAISRQVSELITNRKWDEAEQLAQKGLALCETTAGFQGFCLGQFNESLGDIAFVRGKFIDSLQYYQKSSKFRDGIVGKDSPTFFAAQLRLGRTYLALRQLDAAEPLLKEATEGLGRVAPATQNMLLGIQKLRELYLSNGKLDEEVAVTRQEMEWIQRNNSSNAGALQREKLLLNTVLLRQAKRLSTDNKDADAERILLEAIQLIDPPHSGAEKYLGVTLVNLGALYYKLHRFAEAEPVMLRALDYRMRFSEPSDPNIPAELSNLAALYQEWGKLEASIPYAVQSISKFDEDKIENVQMGLRLFELGRTYRRVGRPKDAEPRLLRAKEVLDRVLPESDTRHISVRTEIGSIFIDQERFGEAERVLQSALQIEPKLPRPATGWRSSVLSYLGLLYRDRAQYREAEKALQEAIELDEAGGPAQAKVLAQRLTELASIYRRQNRYTDAESQLSRSLALDQADGDRATALNSLGVIYTSTDRYEKAEIVLDEALAIRKKVLPANSFFIAETVGNLAMVDASKGRYATAEAKLRYACEVVDATDQPRSSNVALYSSLLSSVLVSEGKLDEAAGLIRHALDIYQQQLGPNHPRFGGALKTLALIETTQGRDREAEDHYRQALIIDEKMIGPESPAVAADLMSLVPISKRAGKRQEAKAYVERALAINLAQFGADSSMTVGPILASADMAYENGQYTEARLMMERALQIQERTSGPNSYQTVGIWIFTTRLDLAQGRSDDAVDAIDRAAKIVATTLPPDHLLNIGVLEGKADIAAVLGKLPDAEQHCREALAIAEKSLTSDHGARHNAVDRLTRVLWAQGKFVDAVRLQRDELNNVESKLGSDHTSTAIAARSLAVFLSSAGRQDEAAELFRRALAIDERAFGTRSDQVARGHFALASLSQKMGRFEDARLEINLARRAWEEQGHFLAANAALEVLAQLSLDQGSPAESVIFAEQIMTTAEQAFGPDSPILVGTIAQLGRFYALAGQTEAAEKALARIIGLIGGNPSELAPGCQNMLQLRGILGALQGRFRDSEADFSRAIAIATKYGGPQSNAVGANSFNLAAVYLRAERFQDAIASFARATDILKRENGERSPVVGYALLGAAQSYERIGDHLSSKALLAAAVEILGPTIAAQRPEPKWL